VALVEELPPTYQRFLSSVAHGLWEKNKAIPASQMRISMVALLFARPELPLAREEIIPSLAYYHVRSGRSINFYCAGYKTGEPFSDDTLIGTIGGHKSFFSTARFDAARAALAAHSTWQYSGDCDLILANAGLRAWSPSPFSADAYLDFSSALSVNLDKMKTEGAIDSVPSFFEKIVNFTEQYDGSDPTWGFSDAEAKTLAGSALKSVLLSLLPKPVRSHFKQAFHFAVRDIHPKDDNA
jgi:hypothetical protein